MKLATALLLSVLTLCLLALLDSGCEAYADNLPMPGPAILVFVDAISPIHISYIILPMCVGLASWFSDLKTPYLFLPIILFTASIVLAAISLSMITLLNAPREISGYRYIGNAFMIGLACFLAYHAKSNQNANKAVDSTATRVTPPAEQEPRHGQP